MDKTIEFYNQKAQKIAAHFETLLPQMSYEMAMAFFYREGKTVDVGSGSGRDTAFLLQQGFDIIGVDPSEGMLEQARLLHPECAFHLDSLPNLSTLESGRFDNLMSNAVIMHLPEAELALGLASLLRVLRIEGRGVLSFRGPSNEKFDQGRLFTQLSSIQVARALEGLGAKILRIEEVQKQNLWHYIAFEKRILAL